MRNSFGYYQQLLANMSERPEVVSAEDVTDMGFASVEERGRLAISSLVELDNCWKAMDNDIVTEQSHEFFMLAIDGLKDFNGFTYKDFAYVADKGSLFPLLYMLTNKSCPVDFFVDCSYSRIDKQYSDILRSFGCSSFEDVLSALRWDRISDVAAFLRNKEPGLETLSDEMVLTVSGVAFSRY